jgi:hypothetical protein
LPESLSLSAVGASVLTEGIKFLYGQGTELLKVWRQRRERAERGEPSQSHEEVPVPRTAALDGTPTVSEVDGPMLDREALTLVQLTGILSLYVEELVEVDSGNEELVRQADSLRGLLEALYGERFTFLGEQRERTGTRVDIKQVLGTVHGDVIALDAKRVDPGSDIDVQQSVQEAHGDVLGARINVIGGQ